MPTDFAPQTLLFESLHIDGSGILVSGKCGRDYGTDFLQTRIRVEGDGTLHFSLEQRGFGWFDVLKLDPPNSGELLAAGFIPAHTVLETYRRLMLQGAIDKFAMLISNKMETIYNEAAKAMPAPLGFALLTHFTATRFTQLEEICAKNKPQQAKAPAKAEAGKFVTIARHAEIVGAFESWLVDNAGEAQPPATYLRVEPDDLSVYAGDKRLWSSEEGYEVPFEDSSGREPLTLTRLVATFQANIRVFADLLAAKAPEEK